ISLARTDGCSQDVLEMCTHTPKKGSAIDLYTTFPWQALCEENAIKDAPRREHNVGSVCVGPLIRARGRDTPGATEQQGRERREWLRPVVPRQSDRRPAKKRISGSASTRQVAPSFTSAKGTGHPSEIKHKVSSGGETRTTSIERYCAVSALATSAG